MDIRLMESVKTKQEMQSALALMRPLTISELDELKQKYNISQKILHLLGLVQSGIKSEASWMSNPTSVEFGGLNLEIWPSHNPKNRFFKSIFVPPHDAQDKTPYRFCEETSRILFQDMSRGIELDTGLRARRKQLLSYQSPHYYFYQKEPKIQISMQPLKTPCVEGCRFCPVTYWSKTLTEKYNPIEGDDENLFLISPENLMEKVIHEPLLEQYGGLDNVEQIALATTRFRKYRNWDGVYEEYAIRLGQAGKKLGFKGRMFLLSDRIRSTEQILLVKRELLDKGIPIYFAYTLEVANNGLRGKIMPGNKGKLSYEEIINVLKTAKHYLGSAGAFYIVGLEDIETSISVLHELVQIGVKPCFNALNPLTPGIYNLFFEKDIFARLDGLIKVQREIIAIAIKQLKSPEDFVAENNNALIPKNLIVRDTCRLEF